MTLFKMYKGKTKCEIVLNVDGRYLFDDPWECRDFRTEGEAVEYARHLGYTFT